MKEKIYSLIVILAIGFFPAVLLGQSSESNTGKGFSIGLKGGVNLSSWSNVEVTDPVKKIYQKGYQGGLVTKIGFSKKLALQFEFLYAPKGLRIKVPQYDDNDQEIIYNSWHKVNYFEIPLFFKFSAPMGPISIYGDLGTYAAMGLSAETATDPDLGRNEELNFFLGGFKKIDYGLLFGAGLGYKIGKGELLLDVRYDYGLTDINNVTEETKALPDYKKYKNRNAGISIGYLIRLGK